MNHLFQATHAPMGACASFDLGLYQGGGGFSMLQERAASEDIYIGYTYGKEIICLPFVKQQNQNSIKSFVGKQDIKEDSGIKYVSPKNIERIYSTATDSFITDNMRVTVYNRSGEILEPKKNMGKEIADKIMPSIILTVSFDNSDCEKKALCFFGLSGMKGKRFLSDSMDGMLGVCSGDNYGFAVEARTDLNVTEFSDFGIDTMLRRRKPVRLTLADIAGLLVYIPAGRKISMDIAIGFFSEGIVTAGNYHCRFLYTKFYKNLNEVLKETLKKRSLIIMEAYKMDESLKNEGLSETQQFLYAHSEKTYHRCTELLVEGEMIHYVVEEGSFRMLSTFDLLIDHIFFELRYHPWTVRNQLEWYMNDYSYEDSYGISFTHDMGTHNTFTPKGRSCYEIPNETGCFSYMTQEQLCNFVLCMGCYVSKTKDWTWIKLKRDIIIKCFSSVLKRCGNGAVMVFDSDFCEHGCEITTYDSLNKSLGKANGSSYLAVKLWAVFLSFQYLFQFDENREMSDFAEKKAVECATQIIAYWNQEEGFFPAILNHSESLDYSVTLPLIEGLIYPFYMNIWNQVMDNKIFMDMILKLRIHCEKAIKTEKCVFKNGGLRLSSSSDNSWMSKIFLVQYIMKNILHLENEDKWDRAHALWWIEGCPSCPGIDQIFNGTQEEQYFFYPRAVTSYLWRKD